VKIFQVKSAQKAGTAPGHMMHLGTPQTGPVQINQIQYNSDQFDEHVISSSAAFATIPQKEHVTWLDVNGVHDLSLVERLGKAFGIHPLVLEDIVHTGHRPKIEVHDNFIFVVIRMLFFDNTNNEILSEQISIILGENYLLTFQERPGDVFEPIRERLRSGKYRISSKGVDYLLYSLLDAVVDNYFLVLEKIGQKLERIEDKLLHSPSTSTLEKIYQLKKDLVFLRKVVWPLREVINSLSRNETSYIEDQIAVYFHDIYDHVVQTIETIETFRDMLSGMRDTYLSNVSNRMNEVMKVLTIISTIFIPITFLAGIYGMNFVNIPELKWTWSYPALWGVMLSIVVILLWIFKRKKWL
jgi:magnesium transporter